jgi:threonylcarbamoyladenosine tRNA methylthiotransferase MtaB
LTGINTEYFGIGKNVDITDLVDEIFNKTNIPRVSFGSIHPWSINDKFIAWYEKNAQNKRFVHFFHIPIQSGSDRILTLMNRGYQTTEISNKIKTINKINHNALIATDIIVGFPGETESDFQKTYKFLEDNPINRFHVFRYSAKKGTSSYNTGKTLTEVSEQEKKHRSNMLIKLSTKKLLSQKKKMIGITTKAFILNKAKDGYWQGLLPNQIPISIAGYNKNIKGIKNVVVQKIQNDTLYGRLVN